MRLRTVAKLGMVLSVVLFCTAVGFYGFAKLSLTDKSREINLFSLVPADCIGVLESDNINYFLNEFPQLNYSEELGNFQFPGLFNYVLGGLNEYTTNTAHGLSSKMSRVVVSFHSPGTPRDQVVYFRMGADDKETLGDMLLERTPGSFSPKKEKYRGKTIAVYPLGNNDFLAVYSEAGFYVERDSQKGIVIGKGGSALKKVGTLARKDIEVFFDKKVFLELYVKVEKDWRSRENKLKGFGYIPE